MATLTRTYYQPHALRLTLTKKVEEIIEALLPRRCMVVSACLVLAGLGIPLLMAIGILPISFLLGLLGLILAMAGSILALALCGEI